MSMISIIVSADRNGVIGRENRIPWRIRDDLVRLKERTLGHTVILGRLTYDSMSGYYDRSGRSMPGKIYIVVTRNPSYKPSRDNARVVHSVEEAVAEAKKLEDEIFVLGGATIFKELLPMTDRIYLTKVMADARGDVSFPELNPGEWREVSREHHKKDDRNEYDYDIVTLERV